MSPRLAEAAGAAAVLFFVGAFLTYRSYKSAPEWIAADLDKLERYQRSNKTLRWLGPVLVLISVIIFLAHFFSETTPK